MTDFDITAAAADAGTHMPTAETLEQTQQAIADRLEKELRGAWRAGYDYLHVYGPRLGEFNRDEIFMIRQGVIPSDREHPPVRSTEDWVYSYTYDLTSVPDGLLRQAIRGELHLSEVVDQ